MFWQKGHVSEVSVAEFTGSRPFAGSTSHIKWLQPHINSCLINSSLSGSCFISLSSQSFHLPFIFYFYLIYSSFSSSVLLLSSPFLYPTGLVSSSELGLLGRLWVFRLSHHHWVRPALVPAVGPCLGIAADPSFYQFTLSVLLGFEVAAGS